MSRETGGPVHPCTTITHDRYAHATTTHHTGMTMRDYFAAKAMAGYVARGSNYETARVVAHAYELADAMLAERSK